MLNTIIVADEYAPCVEECENPTYSYSSNAISGCRWACLFLKTEMKTLSECKASCRSQTGNGLYYNYERDVCEESCGREGMKFDLYMLTLYQKQ